MNYTYDNRDFAEVQRMHEATIESLKRELAEEQALRRRLTTTFLDRIAELTAAVAAHRKDGRDV